MKPFLDAMVKLSNKNMKIALKASRTAAGATGTQASKLSLLRHEVLEACAGYDGSDLEEEAFAPPPRCTPSWRQPVGRKRPYMPP
jgi:hypothetical protein